LLNYLQDTQLEIRGTLIKPVSPSTLFDATLAAFGKQSGVSAHHSAPPPVAGQEPNLRGASILLVEDHVLNQELASEILSAAGIRVDIACNGQEALAKLEQSRYDGILMDCQMPIMDGYEATRRIRADARFAELPIIAMTANTMSGDRDKCLQQGMNDHIAKPIDVEAMLTTLARWLKPVNLLPGSKPAGSGRKQPRTRGLDSASALARLSGNVTLYRKILARFLESQKDTAKQIRGAFAQNDAPGALRLVHTLKGLAGSIGASELANAAAAFEQTFRQGETPELEAQLHKIETLLASTRKSIEQILLRGLAPETPTAPLPPAPTVQPLTIHLRELATALAESDTRALGLLAPIAGMLHSSAVEADFRRLAHLAERYAFDEAMDVLRAIAEQLEIRLD